LPDGTTNLRRGLRFNGALPVPMLWSLLDVYSMGQLAEALFSGQVQAPSVMWRELRVRVCFGAATE